MNLHLLKSVIISGLYEIINDLNPTEDKHVFLELSCYNFVANNVIYANIIDLSKKRKLQDTEVSLPIRKLIFRDRSPGSEEEDVPQTLTLQVNNDSLYHDDDALQPDSEMGSNSFAEESDSAMSRYIEVKSELQLQKGCNLGQRAKAIWEFSDAYACDKPSTSSGSCGSNDEKNTLHSFPFIDDQNLQYGYDTDYVYSEGKIGETDEPLDGDLEDAMIYSTNGGSSDMFVLSSGRWKINQDAQGEIRKPTIDQEFEQYFSSLML
ncbi:hypothetical protein ACHQM5_020226 [Ranunculus cassubicifolius]